MGDERIDQHRWWFRGPGDFGLIYSGLGEVRFIRSDGWLLVLVNVLRGPGWQCLGWLGDSLFEGPNEPNQRPAIHLSMHPVSGLVFALGRTFQVAPG